LRGGAASPASQGRRPLKGAKIKGACTEQKSSCMNRTEAKPKEEPSKEQKRTQAKRREEKRRE